VQSGFLFQGAFKQVEKAFPMPFSGFGVVHASPLRKHKAMFNLGIPLYAVVGFGLLKGIF
jgi:hypothetical protein